ncbi:hypothetical protein MED121_09008 [Marinomonas sp. MED121]|uniref:hypothetical protein n=1 Tax=Marinomonas sp. MED121 TaxID=314277 RepID=UPI000069004C|nr:hypothetical protein [Marinomonas sp. MED121]EAQ65692.1 hypothetical protein MED121_09008 [Marinomonas sp. MED121]
MNKLFGKGDYAAFISLLSLSIKLIKSAESKSKSIFITLVSIYILSIFLQGFAIGLFYFGVKNYIDNSNVNYIARLISFIPMELNAVEQLVISSLPAFVLLLLSSKVLSYSRVGLSRLVLRLRDSSLIKLDKITKTIDEAPSFYRELDGTFGAMRALYLNAFVFAQAFIAICVLSYFEPILSLINIAFLFVFFYFLTLVKRNNRNNDKEPLDIDVEDEGVGISSKSFERLEKMRIFGRNSSNIILFLSVILGIFLSLDFITSLDSLTLIFFLLRYISNIYTPISVISASCVPYKENIVTFLNIENFTYYENKNYDCEVPKKRALVFVSKSYKEKHMFLDIELRGKALEKLSSTLNCKRSKYVPLNITDDYPIKKSKIKQFYKNKFRSTDKIIFCI